MKAYEAMEAYEALEAYEKAHQARDCPRTLLPEHWV